MSNVAEVFQKMGQRFNAEAASDMEEVFQFDIDDTLWYTAIADGKCEIAEAEHDDPSVTLTMDEATFMGVISGDTDGMTAFMEGKIKASGKMMLATQLSTLFPK